ncbi:TerB family tellurite resistance protein [Kordiimonas gwangyangensis]|uniref:TerB family tellurite resistance protein n=1 Tax=Kordiimonas gwangyangensis TaxID=288022 RepID=UPI0003667291|nr:TerB family tellurite resistance protein [Kordiimonas gwangyangensis]
MPLAQLENIMRLFRGSELDEAGRKELVREALVMALSRATIADTNIAHIEVKTVQRIIKERTGEEVSEKDIRVAALSDLYKEATLEKYLAKVRSKIGTEDCKMIVGALAEVIKIDEKVSPFEVEFFNSVAGALGMSHADCAGLIE